MENPDITAKAAYCLSCPSPRCETLCPTGNHIRDFIKAVKDGDVEEAARILYATNPFPEFTSALCDHARQCRKGCVRGIKGEAVDVPAIESYIALRYGRPYRTPEVKNGKRVACIGTGPANLSAAFFLLEKGYVVDFYEQEDGIGGAILTGIPGFRFDKKALEKVYQDLLDLGANFRFR
ncbi:MAG: NAD(P)-binding protein, partial [Bacilli bacterium]|nr:NAD(P)-binding protein [Bacilli bacterium]